MDIHDARERMEFAVPRQERHPNWRAAWDEIEAKAAVNPNWLVSLRNHAPHDYGLNSARYLPEAIFTRLPGSAAAESP